MAIWLAVGIAGLLAAPHLLAHDRLTPTGGIVLFSAALVLRAALAIGLAIIFIFFLPATQLFGLMTHWCLHAVVPFVATHLGFDGHSLGDVATLVPALVTAASLISVGFGAWQGARAVRGWLQRSYVGEGPQRSVIVGSSDVIVAAAGLRDPNVVVSAGALLSLDDAELTASLQHEWGHVVHRHRYISLLGHGCRAVSRFLPGGSAALRALELHLERDADAYAVQQTGNRLALASAICKAAGADVHPPASTAAALTGSGVPQRLRHLVRTSPTAPSRLARRTAGLLAATMIAAALGLAAVTPKLAEAGIHQLAKSAGDSSPDCE